MTPAGSAPSALPPNAAQIVWLVESGGPEDSRLHGIFADLETARLAYIGAKMSCWREHAMFEQRHGGVCEMSEDKEWPEGGWYCDVASLYWVHCIPKIVTPSRPPTKTKAQGETPWATPDPAKLASPSLVASENPARR